MIDNKKERISEWNVTAYNKRFGVMVAEARRNGSANLKVCTPQEVQWKPPLRQAATTLAVMRDCAVNIEQNIVENFIRKTPSYKINQYLCKKYQ